jgi:8-oxo-dGTP pyrophosphatase MutT (NUDIX family)
VTPEQVWARALEEEVGIAITCPADFETLLHEYRKGKSELFGFYVFRRGEEVLIVRAKNLSAVRTDGDYRPMEE